MKMRYFALLCLLFATLSACAGHQASEIRLRQLDNGIVEDVKTGLQWQFDKSHELFSTQEEAAAYAAGLDLGGNKDWRLPSLEERWGLLQVFVYKDNNGVEFPLFGSKYWTMETKKGAQPIKLDITCLCQGTKDIDYKTEGYVRAVRGTEVKGK